MAQRYISVYYADEDTLVAQEVTAFLTKYGFRYATLNRNLTEAERGERLRESVLLLVITSPIAAELQGGAEIMRQAFIKRLPMVSVSLEDNELDRRFQTGDSHVSAVKWPHEGLFDPSAVAALVHQLCVRCLCRYPESFEEKLCAKDAHGRVIREAVQAYLEDPEGQYALGEAYRHGRGLPARDTEAAFWLEKAAEKGHPHALIAAGQFRLDGRGVDKDEEQAFGMFLRAAEVAPNEQIAAERDPAVLGRHHVALCYSRGLGVVKDDEVAARYYLQAAERGYAPARYRLGLLYRDGVGVRADWHKAVQWLCRATGAQGKGDVRRRAYRNVSMRHMQQDRLIPLLQKRNGHEVVTRHARPTTKWWFRRVGGYAEDLWLTVPLGDVSSLRKERQIADARTLNVGRGFSTWEWDVSFPAVELGRLLESGSLGGEREVKPNPLGALHFYRMAIGRQHSVGCRLAADLYLAGHGVPADPVQAVRLYRRAAELGNERAMFSLGVCFEQGIGIDGWADEAADGGEMNKTAAEWAVEWYRKSAVAGYAPAQNNLGGCYEAGFGVAHDPVQAVNWYTRAAVQKQPEACCRLARCYEVGFGVERNPDRAVALYHAAADRGNTYAWYRVGVCYERGIGLPTQRGQAADWYRRSAERGVPEAQYAYALCLRAGRGVRRDEQSAYEWFRAAARQGHIAASWEVGEYLLEGRLVLQSQERAVGYLRGAVEGYERVAAVTGFEIETLPELAISSIEAAGRALYRLSCCVRYEEGISVENPEAAALELVKQAARLEEPGAMTALADWYAHLYRGGGNEQTFSCAEGWYRRAMDAGQTDAPYRLACLLWDRSSVADEGAGAAAAEAAGLFQGEALRGHVQAMCRVAECYMSGKGLPQDTEAGFGWLCRAADAAVPSVRAMVLVGDCYRMGWGVEASADRALAYTRRAALSRPYAEYPWMGERCPRWYVSQMRSENSAARTEAKLRMAVYGSEKEDDGERFFYLCEAVLDGHSTAVEHAARMIHTKSTPATYFAAVQLTPKTMDTSLYPAAPEALTEVTPKMRGAVMNYIGDGYFEGRIGLPRAPEKAVRCYRSAASLPEQAWAQYSLGWCLLHGVGTPSAPTEAVGFLTRAAAVHGGACYELATCYEKGRGVDVPNLRVALKYYRKALKLGETRAAVKVREIGKILKKRAGI